ncbi:MAG: AAA family ATPase [Alphaproteobacteria bacterium]|nr:AAA family ATPase [Alphaproteobacteria bacterium]MBO6863716.1 AAA family ATPase [Alphaproteobacteria bacterium]
MKLVSFSVENFRSITNARKIPLSSYSLLVGANNEGKSNILHALALAMEALSDWRNQVRYTSDGKLVRMTRRRFRSYGRRDPYDWSTDFPVSKQGKNVVKDKTEIILEFELTDDEINEFKEEIKSNLNGTLPIKVIFGKEDYDVTVAKPGKGHVTLTRKGSRIANFVSERIRFEYIPAIRTADTAQEVITRLVDSELFVLERDPEYQSALNKIEELQKPVFDELASTIRETVSNFLPSVKNVQLRHRREARQRALRREIEIVVDDGQETLLGRKGDGIQSLTALALMRHASERYSSALGTIIAIEEPESHLHPRAIHELRSVIESLSANNQIVLTSHSPLFVRPQRLDNTIVVKNSTASCAKNISEIRDTLGVRFSDNLENARIVLLVEGADDVSALTEILSFNSSVIKSAIEQGVMVLDSLGGASSLRQKASFYKSSACVVHAFLDNDKEGQAAIERALSDGTLDVSEINKATVGNMKESEIEDLYDVGFYGPYLKKKFGVDMGVKGIGKGRKWSNRLESIFVHNGMHWNNSIKNEIKWWLSDLAKENPGDILNKNIDGPIQSLVSVCESKIKDQV